MSETNELRTLYTGRHLSLVARGSRLVRSATKDSRTLNRLAKVRR